MKLTRLEIIRLPGIQPGFALEDIAPGINVVVGPNASGKSNFLSILFFQKVLQDLRVYDFITGQLTGTSSQKGKNHLEEDGNNVALVLRNLLQDDEKRRKFLNLTSVLLPFVEDLDVDRFAGQSLLVKLQESHTGDAYLPASLLSEGSSSPCILRRNRSSPSRSQRPASTRR